MESCKIAFSPSTRRISRAIRKSKYSIRKRSERAGGLPAVRLPGVKDEAGRVAEDILMGVDAIGQL